MPETVELKFGCDGCGKKYTWKPEMTAKKAKCKCGAVITVPDLSVQSDDPPPLPDDGIFDFIDNAPEVQSERVQALRSAAIAPVAVAAPAKPVARGPVLGYRQGPTPRDQKRAREAFETMHDMKRDVYVPVGLLVGSFLAYFAFLLIHGNAKSGSSLAVYGGVMALLFGVKTIIMIGGAFIVASLAGVSFGPLSTAILKLAAVATAPDILGTIVEEAIGVPGAGLMAWALSLALYWFLVSWLFSMDASEAWGVVVLFGVLRWILTAVLSMVLLGLMLGGSAVGAGGMGALASGAAAPSRTASPAAVQLQEKVDEWKDNELLVEGLDYIDKTGRLSGYTGEIKALYAAGAKNVWIHVARDINGKKEPVSMVVEWPKDDKRRAAVLKAINDSAADRLKDFMKEHPDFPPTTPPTVTDEGGKYSEVDLGL